MVLKVIGHTGFSEADEAAADTIRFFLMAPRGFAEPLQFSMYTWVTPLSLPAEESRRRCRNFESRLASPRKSIPRHTVEVELGQVV